MCHAFPYRLSGCLHEEAASLKKESVGIILQWNPYYTPRSLLEEPEVLGEGSSSFVVPDS
jgi:hypothetical protein